MPPQVIVPHRPGPLREVRERPEHGESHRAGIGVPEIALSAGGGLLMVAVLAADWPGWLSVVAVGCLTLGLGLPAHAALLRARHHRSHAGGTLLDVSDGSVCRLVTAYRRLERTAGPGPARDAAHLAVAEAAAFLDGHPPEGEAEAYVARRAEAVSALADHLTEHGRVGEGVSVELAGSDSLARIEALLGG